MIWALHAMARIYTTRGKNYDGSAVITRRGVTMIVLMVNISIKPEHKEECMEAMMGDAIGSNRDEPGCLRFDVLQDSEDPNLIHLYEVYKDEAALEAHRQAPHYVKWRSAVLDWWEGPPTRSTSTNVFPADNDWR
jgi:autoinducer 2-degrading protein